MDKIDKVKLLRLEKELAKKYNLTLEELREVVNSPYKFAKETINQLDLKEITKEEYDELKHVFIFRKLGKIFISWKLINKRNKQRENIKKLNIKKWKK